MKALIINNEIQVICPEPLPEGETLAPGSRIEDVEICPLCRGNKYVEAQKEKR